MDDTGFLHDPCSDINLLQDDLRSRYDLGFPILKELVQNADDARAQSLHLGWTPGLSGAAHPLLQGPAIFAINDGEFKPLDARAIRCLGLNAKAADRTSIGKFGLGLKSVFHLCEAFFFLSSAKHPQANGILNPWAGRGDSSIHRDWNTFSPDDQARVRDHLNSLLKTPNWFCLWIPLRRQEQLDGHAPIIKEFPGKDVSAPRWMTGTDAAFNLARLLPLLRCVQTVSISAPWKVGVLPAITVRLQENSSRRNYPGQEKLAGSRFFEGRVSIKVSGNKPVEARYVAQESWLTQLEVLREDASWPEAFSISPRTGKAEYVKEKADPHFAVSFLSQPEAGDGLRSAKAVFLPLTREFPSPCEGPKKIDLLLHGYFFVDAGRGDLEQHVNPREGSSPDKPGEGHLRARWNEQLWSQGTLSLVLTTLERFCTQTRQSPRQIRELTASLQQLPFIKDALLHVCKSGNWIYRLRGSERKWELVPGDFTLLELPQPEDGNEQLPFLALPRLAEVAEEIALTIADCPQLAVANPSRIWPEPILQRIFASPTKALMSDPMRVLYLSRFLVNVLPPASRRGASVGPLCGFVRELCRSVPARPTEDIRRAVTRILREVPPDRRRTLPLPQSPLAEEAWALLARSPCERVLYPEAFEPDDMVGKGQLAPPRTCWTRVRHDQATGR